MNVNEMRKFIKAEYPLSVRWPGIVDKMKDEQVIAVHLELGRRKQNQRSEKK